MGTKNIVNIVILLMPFTLTAQKKNTINYLNQRAPGTEAQVFAPGIISTEALEHSSPAFSPDGKTVVWSIMKMPTYQTCLLEMHFANNKWSTPSTPSFSDTTFNEVYPDFSPNGDTLFFSSDRVIDSISARSNTLWYVTRKPDDGWSSAKPLDISLYKKDVYANSVSARGTRYVTVGPHGTPDWNVYNTDKSGAVILQTPNINTPSYEDGPFIAPDESYLIFESDRPTTIKGNLDLYISFRKKDGNWAEPVNMGPKINTAFSERFAKVSPDGKYLFFGRNTGKGFDIYWIDAGIIDELKSAN